MSRLGKRVVLLRLFYGGEMRKCVVGRGFSTRRAAAPTPRSPPAAALFRAPRGAKPAEPFSLCGARSNASRLFGTVAILRERATASRKIALFAAALTVGAH
jgi:hypothetical protein